ncbi:MAG TPA: secretion activator protein, partial [Pseudolabrys sp.]|nr:secretion activator protein [Pseudolabrys sp.]
MAAVRAHAPAAIVRDICDERLRFLQSLKTWAVFGGGWGRRVAEVKAAALQMANGQGAAPSLTPAAAAPGRGAVPVEIGAQQGTAGAVVAVGAVAARQAHAAGARPLIIAVIVFATVAAAIGAWLFWRGRQRRKQEA